MSQEPPIAVVPLLSRALQRVRSTPPRIIASPPTQPRRAAVALIIRIVPSPHKPVPPAPSTQPGLTEFFALDWVNDPHARPEILFLQRENPAKNGDGPYNQTQVRQGNAQGEAQVAFPGGRMEPDDEGGLYTAMRQTWEELGIDLAEKDYLSIGQLDDREITTSLGKRLLMILSPFVFLQVTPAAPPADPVSTTQLHWTPLASLISPNTKGWSSVTVDAASRLTPKHSALLRVVVRMLVGTMQFPAIVIQPSPSGPEVGGKAEKGSKQSIAEKGTLRKQPQQLKLWGLSLGMTLDLMSYMILPTVEDDDIKLDADALNEKKNDDAGDYFDARGDRRRQRGGSHSAPSTPLSEVMQLPYQDSTMLDFRMEYVAPSLASVFPRFSYPDVNFWIWVFGKRYREVIRGWESSVRAGGVNDRRINWSGSALSTFYAAIRKALIVVIVGRALGIIVGLGFAVWWVLS